MVRSIDTFKCRTERSAVFEVQVSWIRSGPQFVNPSAKNCRGTMLIDLPEFGKKKGKGKKAALATSATPTTTAPAASAAPATP